VLLGCSTLPARTPVLPASQPMLSVPVDTIVSEPAATRRIAATPSTTGIPGIRGTSTPVPTASRTSALTVSPASAVGTEDAPILQPTAASTLFPDAFVGDILVLFTSESNHPYSRNLYKIDPNTGNRILLLSGLTGFSLSPVGRQLAYVQSLEAVVSLNVWSFADDEIVNLQTGQKEIDDLGWSPDGQLLAFTQYGGDLGQYNDGEIYVFDIEGRCESKLADGFDPAWSPNGQRLAYATIVRKPPYERNSVEIVDRVTGDRQVVFDVDPETWKPGQRIDFWPDYGEPMLQAPSWSPDGNYLLFSASAQPDYLYRIALDSDEMLTLTSAHLSPGITGLFTGSADEILALVARRGGIQDLLMIAVADKAQIVERQLNAYSDIVICSSLSQDGRSISYIATNEEWSQISLVVYDLLTDKERARYEIFGETEEMHTPACEISWARLQNQ
jgi:Tol biopolymer transport system component